MALVSCDFAMGCCGFAAFFVSIAFVWGGVSFMRCGCAVVSDDFAAGLPRGGLSEASLGPLGGLFGALRRLWGAFVAS